MNTVEIKNWPELPPELITSILLRLTATDLLNNAQKVCRSWRRVVKDPLVWSKIEICYLNHTDYDLEDTCRHAVELNQVELLEIRKHEDNDCESWKEEDDIDMELEKSNRRFDYIMQKVKDVLVKDSKGTIVMVVSVTALTTKGNPLPEDVLRKTIEACDQALDLDTARKKILDFVESKMSGSIAPNLSAVVGSDVAAKIVCEAGGLSALAEMPPCNVELLSHKKRKNLAGFFTVTRQYSHVRFIERTYMFQTTPPGLRTRASRLLAAKSTLAARVDATREDPSGTKGKAFRDEISKKIKKWQESSPTMELKPLLSTWKELLFGLFQ